LQDITGIQIAFMLVIPDLLAFNPKIFPSGATDYADWYHY